LANLDGLLVEEGVVGVVGDRIGNEEEWAAVVESFFNFHEALANSSLAALRRCFDSVVSFLVFFFLVFFSELTSLPLPSTAAIFVSSLSSSSPLRGPIRLGWIRRGVSVLKVLRRSKEERDDSWCSCS